MKVDVSYNHDYPSVEVSNSHWRVEHSHPNPSEIIEKIQHDFFGDADDLHRCYSQLFADVEYMERDLEKATEECRQVEAKELGSCRLLMMKCEQIFMNL